MTTDLVRTVTDERRCVLYRHFDEEGELLYIGISDTPVDRMNSHARSSDWVQYAAHAKMDWYSSRERAAEAERTAIQALKPVFNRQYALWDVDQAIAAYLQRREMRTLKKQLEAYRLAAEAILEAAPAALRAGAMVEARGSFIDPATAESDPLWPPAVLICLSEQIDTWSAFDAATARTAAFEQVRDYIDGLLPKDSGAEWPF